MKYQVQVSLMSSLKHDVQVNIIRLVWEGASLLRYSSVKWVWETYWLNIATRFLQDFLEFY